MKVFEGVDESRLLATRNRVLADAMRVLGLAGRDGIGISAMYRTMLRDGHFPPDITASGGDVVCRLPSGRVDEDVQGFFDSLARTESRFDEDVRYHIAITELLSRTPLRAENLASAAHCSEEEAFDVLRRLADVAFAAAFGACGIGRCLFWAGLSGGSPAWWVCGDGRSLTRVSRRPGARAIA